MIEYSIVAARVKKLTIGPILVQVDALWLVVAVGHHLAQRRILVSKILTRIGAILSNTTFYFRIVETLFRV